MKELMKGILTNLPRERVTFFTVKAVERFVFEKEQEKGDGGMKKAALFLVAWLLISGGWFSGLGFSESFSQEGVKSRGVIFNVAEDRKIDHVNGYQEPEAIDKYIKRKFDDVYSQLQTVNEKLDKIAAQLQAMNKR